MSRPPVRAAPELTQAEQEERVGAGLTNERQHGGDAAEKSQQFQKRRFWTKLISDSPKLVAKMLQHYFRLSCASLEAQFTKREEIALKCRDLVLKYQEPEKQSSFGGTHQLLILVP